MKFWKLVSFLGALVVSSGANAALVTASFTSTTTVGEFAGSVATGTFTYDDSLISSTGSEFLDTTDGLTVVVDVFGQTFTDIDDIAKGGTHDWLPEVEFFDGVATFLDFWVSEVAFEEYVNGVLEIQPNVVEINQPGVMGFGSFQLYSTGLNTYDGSFEVEVSAVPVPAAAWLFFSGLIGLIGFARRK